MKQTHAACIQGRPRPSEVRRLNRTVIHPLLLAAVSALFLALLSCDKHAEGGAPAIDAHTPAPAVDVSVFTPTRATIPRTVRTTGTLYGDEEATIASKVSGRIVQTLVDLGDSVAPGEVLVRIDPVDYTLALDERRRALSEALSRLGLASLPPEGEPFDVDAVPLVQRAIVEAENARTRYERARQLVESDPPLMGPQEFSDIQTTYDVARSDVAVQRLNAGSLLALARTFQVQVSIAEQRLADTEPRAPDSPTPDASGSRVRVGTYLIAQRSVSVGDFVQVGTPLVRVVVADPVKLRLSIPERRSAEIQIGQPVAIHADASADQTPVTASISRISPALDIATRTLAVEVLILNPDHKLKPGGFATADITVGQDESIVVPASAILTFAGVHKVVSVVDGSAQERRVTLGVHAGDMVQILDGLDGSETLVAAPPGSLTTGTRVRILDEDVAQPASDAATTE